MWSYTIRRLLFMLVIVLLTSIVSFMIVQLPAGDFVDNIALEAARTGRQLDDARLENLRKQFGLDQPAYIQYLRWGSQLLQGNLGWSFRHQQPVGKVIGDRIGLTVTISLSTLLLTYIVAIPIGIYSATNQYSLGDYVAMFVGFLGMSMPGFLLALILMYILLNAGMKVGGLFSIEYMREPWSFAKFVDLLQHLPLPIIIIGTAGTAGLIRVMRASLLDELGRQYVVTARAKGLGENRLLFKYPVRVALNPIASTIGWVLPYIVSGGFIVELVLNLPTVGPKLYGALISEDMFLASSLLFFLTVLTVIGTFISDMVLVLVDPRIRFNEMEA
ncbi:ABC transporter permease [Chloroflexi bacterium TSY]|nr:ABC transporter permease [Chloroflexi bacterium TSY]